MNLKTDLKVGDKIYFHSEKRPYTVRARNERFVICTKPFNARKTVLYTIIDWERMVRGRDNLIFGMGYETEEEIQESMQMLQNHCDNKHKEMSDGLGVVEPFEYQISMEVSYRHFIDLDIKEVRHV